MTAWPDLVERFSARTASMNAILADSAGWRKWCEENPEKCGGQARSEGGTSSEINTTDEVMFAGRNADDAVLFVPMSAEVVEARGAERIASLTQPERAAVTAFAGHAHKVMNEEARRDPPTDRAQRAMNAFDKAAVDLTVDGEPMTLYRGIEMQGANESDLRNAFQVGAVLRTNGMMSTSAGFGMAVRFARPGLTNSLPVVMEIEGKRGVPLQSVAKFKDEHEVVLGNDSQLIVKSIEQRTVRWATEDDETPTIPDEKFYVVKLEQL